ncbi:hypothetical protein BJ508DRAFT_412116 [Ascobolus immersus RN42]|uniref:BZIP domain-containing protein n=1 Tax=Ascobolus immersus RN42 TaxID=1160509 RepID=A0A3N4IMB0_ASCIM|nr:hypothetical protein BJ508DRAFT_412116 [Ascobolus immersus RN42]
MTLEKPSPISATPLETTPVLSYSNSSSPLTLSPNDLLLPTTPTDSTTNYQSEALQRQLSNTNSTASFDSLPPSYDIPPIRINFSRPESMMGPSYKSSSVSASSASPEPSSAMSRTSSKFSNKSTSKARFKDIPDPLAPNTPPTVVKRARNTLAARRYRAKKVEKMEQLEEQLAEMERDRDRWKAAFHKAECEAEKWKGMWLGATGNMGGNGNHLG